MKPQHALALKLAGGAVAMFAFAFALAPLYEVFCEVTGFGGRTGDAPAARQAPSSDGAEARSLRLQFVAINNAQLPWDFAPLRQEMAVTTGQTYLAHYRAVNNTEREMTVQAVPSVAPSWASAYLSKIECFCFERQTLKPGESRDMPIRFVLDRDMPENIAVMTLSYTLFDVSNPLGAGAGS